MHHDERGDLAAQGLRIEHRALRRHGGIAARPRAAGTALFFQLDGLTHFLVPCPHGLFFGYCSTIQQNERGTTGQLVTLADRDEGRLKQPYVKRDTSILRFRKRI